MKITDTNPINPVQRLRDALRCHATAKRTGERCKAPAVRGWRVCRVHGARGGHKAGKTHPQWKHWGRSQKVAELKKDIREFIEEDELLRQLIYD